jgi:GT2 family glycosyltransferase
MPTHRRISVAIVIPTHNRSSLLARTLEALAAVDYPAKSAVVVVDDGSDPDHAAANQTAASRFGARYLQQPNAGPAAARNRGVAVTSSELVAFLDDDCAPARDWLDELTEPFTHSGSGPLGGVGGRIVSQPPHNWVSRFCALAEYSVGVQPVFTNAATPNACFARHVLDEVDGFDEGFRHPGGDDPDLSRRVREAGYELRFVPDAVVSHAEIDSLCEFLQHLFRRGLGEARGKRKEARRGRLLLRVVLFPLYCGRRARQTWRVTRGKASARQRLAYAAFEAVGGLFFIAGTIAGLSPRSPSGRLES